MNIHRKIAQFAKRNEGAVTVDWVVITAMVCGLCIAAYTGVQNEVVDQSSDIAATIEAQDVTGLPAGAHLGTAGGD